MLWGRIVPAATLVSALVLVGVTAAAHPEPERESASPGQAKQTARAIDATGLDASEIGELRARGIGWGLIRKAGALASSEGTSFDEALERVQADEGSEPSESGAATAPGQLRKAAEIAEASGFSPEEIQALREQGLGWGVIRKAAALAAADGIPLQEAVASVTAPAADGG